MYITTNNGDFECADKAELKRILKDCFSRENEIWCSVGKDDEFPCLSFLTDESGASVNYFSEGNESQFVSVLDMDKTGREKFLGGLYEVECCQIIPIEKAVECALEFFETREKPDCIEWEEL